MYCKWLDEVGNIVTVTGLSPVPSYVGSRPDIRKRCSNIVQVKLRQ